MVGHEPRHMANEQMPLRERALNKVWNSPRLFLSACLAFFLVGAAIRVDVVDGALFVFGCAAAAVVIASIWWVMAEGSRRY